MRSNLNFAIAGCGRISGRHVEHIERIGNLVAVCDLDPERANSHAAKCQATAFYDLDTMLSSNLGIDIVAICTPNGLHSEHTVKSLEAGCHVLCEKPMAITSVDCGNMIQAAERANRRLFVVKQNRFNPPVAAVKKAIDDGKLGSIYSVQLNCFWNRNAAYYENDSWKGTTRLDGGCLYTQFSHFIDLLFWMVGDVAEVSSMTDNFAHRGTIEFEDAGVVALRFVNGTLGCIHFTINSYQKNMEGSLTLFAEKGTVKIGGQYLNELEYQEIEDFQITGLPPGQPPNQYGHYVGSMSNHGKVYENVVDVLTNGGSITTNSFEGLKTVEIIEKCYGRSR